MKRLAMTIALAAFAVSAAAGIPEEWKAKANQSGELIKKGNYALALKITDGLIDEMMNALGPGEGSTQLFAIVVMFKAFAEEGLGKADEAAWYWQTAVSILPKIVDSNLASSFGDLAKRLKDVPLEPIPAPLASTAQPSWPRIVRKVEPVYPRGALAFNVSGPAKVKVVITKDGAVRTPRILDSLPAPTLMYAALEAVKQWRFEPARQDGQPIETLFVLTINFRKR